MEDLGVTQDGSEVSKNELWQDPESYSNYYSKATEYWEVWKLSLIKQYSDQVFFSFFLSTRKYLLQ